MAKAFAFSNNDVVTVAWGFDKKVQDCLGFAVYRIDLHGNAETVLPSWVGFKGQTTSQWQPKTTDVWPIQKFSWKDLSAPRGGLYKYRVVALGGQPGKLKPLPNVDPLESNVVQLGPTRGQISAYFNRGILATQFVSHQLTPGADGSPDASVLKQRIFQPNDPLRTSLAGDMLSALTSLLKRAQTQGGDCYLALYELDDPELIQELLGKHYVHIVLSNTAPDDSENQPARHALHQSGVEIYDRMVATGHIGHNKFCVYVDRDGEPQAVLTGSTNWTPNGMCAQTNNAIIVESGALAAKYVDYWKALVDDCKQAGDTPNKLQGAALRSSDNKVRSITLEKDGSEIDLWFSPNTRQQRKPSQNPATPSDMQQVFEVIDGAKQAILFLAFQPGSPSIMDAIEAASEKNPDLFVRGALTDPRAAAKFRTDLYHHSGDKPNASVIPATEVKTPFEAWEKELLSAGHAIIHDKIVVVDPFSDGCVVITGSHNLGYTASYANDENMLIISGHRGTAEAYATHVLDIYDHYLFRFQRAASPGGKSALLAEDDSWQDEYYSDDPASKELAFWLGSTPITAPTE